MNRPARRLAVDAIVVHPARGVPIVERRNPSSGEAPLELAFDHARIFEDYRKSRA